MLLNLFIFDISRYLSVRLTSFVEIVLLISKSFDSFLIPIMCKSTGSFPYSKSFLTSSSFSGGLITSRMSFANISVSASGVEIIL